MNREQIIKTVANHKQELKEKFGVEKIGIMGSYARGEETASSDIDIVVELNKPDLYIMVALKDFLTKLLNNRVDIIRYRKRMNEFLKARIQDEVLYV